MSYTTLTFLLFLAVTGIAYFGLPKRFRWMVLLAASFVFYYLNSGWLIVFLAGCTAAVYLAAMAVAKLNGRYDAKKEGLEKDARKKLKAGIEKQKKSVMVLTLLIIFGMLFLLKYFNFIEYSLNFIFRNLNSSQRILNPNWLMPLGISYYTLQSAGYLIDVYRGKYEAERNFGKLALFVLFFPQMVEGPIGRYDRLADTLYEGHSFDYDRFRSGGQLIIWGVFKKLVIADRAAILVNTVFSHYSNYGGLPAAAAVLLYTFQIYAEFSGCMDIVTGAAEIFGVKLDSNFNQPFASKTVAEFWRRWHITLGAWLRDYIFYPVSMSKLHRNLSKKAREKLSGYWANLLPMAGALFFVWVGMGVWHGASFKYVFYGLYYYFFMILGEAFKPLADKTAAKLKINRESKPYRFLQSAKTFTVVYFGMLIFRSHNITTAWQLFKSIFTGFSLKAAADGSLLKLGLAGSDLLLLFASFVLLAAAGMLHEKDCKIRDTINRLPFIVRWGANIAGILIILIFGLYGSGRNVGTFIYGNF